FLHRAAVNAAVDLVRSRQNVRNIPLDELEPVLAEGSHRGPDRAHSSGEIRDWLRGALGRLNPRIAEMFALRFFEGKEDPELARLRQKSAGTGGGAPRRPRRPPRKRIPRLSGRCSVKPENRFEDPALDQAMSEIRDEAVDPAVIEAAAARVWARLSDAASETH